MGHRQQAAEELLELVLGHLVVFEHRLVGLVLEEERHLLELGLVWLVLVLVSS